MSEERGRRGRAPGTDPGPGPAPESAPAPREPDGTITRRGALKVIAAGAALGATVPGCSPAESGGGAAGADAAHTELSGFNPRPPSTPHAAGPAADAAQGAPPGPRV
ncbi:MAG: hypothetical protein F4Z32_08315 [Gemmatimonadetes bacterium]|nr:hypothetical protein [Gemmatimonadota bacterium]